MLKLKKKSIFGLILLVSLFVNTLVFSSPILASAPQKDVPTLQEWIIGDTFSWDFSPAYNESWVDWNEGNVSSVTGGEFHLSWDGIASDRARIEDQSIGLTLGDYSHFSWKASIGTDGGDPFNCYIMIKLTNTTWVTLSTHYDTDPSPYTYTIPLSDWEWGTQNATHMRITAIGDQTDTIDIEFIRFQVSEWKEWRTAQEIDFLLLTEAYQGMFNAWIVFLGLALIPLAMIFLALKYKAGDLDADTLIIGLIILVLGWALFFGGLI